MRVLLVDDEAAVRTLLRTTMSAVDVELEEAANANEAEAAIVAERPDVIVLDVGLPGVDGLTLCAQLKANEETREIPVVLLTGSELAAEAMAAGANSFLKKPFSPLELLGVIERLAGGLGGAHFWPRGGRRPEEQLLLYARDLRHLLEIERGQRLALQRAYRDTVRVLAAALESKDTGTGAHSQRVQRYALELARVVDADLAADPSAEYGFLLHDVGKIGIPDGILLKPGALSEGELRLMRTHTVVGEQMLGEVSFLRGQGLDVVRHHHERWDGDGYPDGLSRDEIPLGARIFAVADALDAITSDRPYRRAQSWEVARAEIVRESGRQFDPAVVDAFGDCEPALREIRRELGQVA